MTHSTRFAVVGSLAFLLSQQALVAAFEFRKEFNVYDLFVPVGMEEMEDSGVRDPLEQQAWELALSPIEETSLVTCTKRVYGESLGQWVDAPDVYLTAVAEAVKYACNDASPKLSEIQTVYKHSGLYAISQAAAQAEIECERRSANPDNTKEDCFSIETTTSAFAAASMTLHVEAVAEAAVQHCNCDKTSLSTWAAGYASSNVFVKLVSSASTSIDLEVCITGDGTVSDESYDACSTVVTAELFARATASAIASGSCHAVSAGTSALIEISSTVHVESTCDLSGYNGRDHVGQG